MAQKRYVITLDAYLYADDDEQAKARCELYREALQQIDDCRPAVLSLCEQPFGTLGNRQVTIN
ncbi:MAG: hypothetical protein IJ640_00060 [Prevotella sp.]|nr:hypothetical protein [Prevotella sp.]